MKHFLRPALAITCVLAASLSARAFAPPVGSNGPLSIEIEKLQPVEVGPEPREVPVSITLKNALAQPLDGTLEIGLADGWKVTRNPNPAFQLAGNATQTITVGVTPSRGSYSALYPVHASARFTQHGLEVSPLQNPERQASAVLIVQATRAPSVLSPASVPLVKIGARGATPLDVARWMQPRWTLDSAPLSLQSRAPGVMGVDEVSGATFLLQAAARPDARPSISMHPPWRRGAGESMCDFRLALPDTLKLALTFATAIRDSNPGEPLSDGVQFRVLVDTGRGFEPLFDRFSAAKTWESGRVDLSTFRGQTVTLRLQSGPGPARDTSVDQSFWGAPTILAGDAPVPESARSRQSRRAQALSLARAAREGHAGKWSWILRSKALGSPASTWQSAAGVAGAAVVPGPSGLRDAFIAFASQGHELVFEGFELALETPDGRRALGSNSGEMALSGVASTWGSSSGAAGSRAGTVTHTLSINGCTISLRARVWAQGGALRFAWSLPGAAPDLRGTPRIARIALGPASSVVRRVYAGFGNVMQDPGRWSMSDGGFLLSTRHVGADYQNGLSLVQASDIFPDAFEVDGPRGLASLAVHHGATLSLIPSTRGAFAGARVWRDLSGFQAGGGVAKLLGRVGLDQWGGDYAQAAGDLERASAYGLKDAVFIKHDWQRWGYDYRLPDIYPPHGDQGDFLKMVRAAKKSGILFCPHDNYIDFYPDATGFSYKHIIFNEDGTPQLAWLNTGTGAQSYRWNPLEFRPWLDRNLKLVKSGFGPTAYFVDVFSAMSPFDFYDQSGRFYPKMVTAREWGHAFDRIRQVLGDNAPTISEAGADSLIGHLDGGESDHAAWLKPNSVQNAGFGWQFAAGDGERVPWHDMVTHGRFVLFAGGLGGRYASGLDERTHGWGSDDYLSTTILGGRNPMCDGPFSHRAVMTYWLLHDICARLARSEMVDHRFANEDIHRQIVSWADSKTLAPLGTVQVNRGPSDWNMGGKGALQVLPQYGFSARAGSGANEVRADISRRGGLISAFALDARSKTLFADARPEKTSEGGVRARVLGVQDLGGGKFRVNFEWQVLAPIPTGFVPFVHFTSAGAANEGIAFQGGMGFVGVDLSKPGTYHSTAQASLPTDAADGASYSIRFGLFDPKGGARFPIASTSDNGRVKGGVISLRGGVLSYAPEVDKTEAEMAARLNREDKILDFGPLSTNGALRLSYASSTWSLMPLPNSGAFTVSLNLSKLNANGRTIASIQARSQAGASSALQFELSRGRVSFEVPASTRSVSIVLR